ncbi:MAG: hypothetical protein ABEJ36_00180 [Candidatus Nanosalina sp.]
MIDPENSDQVEAHVEMMLLNSGISEQIYGDIEPPEMLDTEDFVENYDADLSGDTLTVSAEMGDTRYDFRNAERDTEGALELFSSVFHNMYRPVFFQLDRVGVDADYVNLNVVGDEGRLTHEMTREEVLEIDEQAKVNTEFRSYGDSPMKTGEEAFGEEADMYEERADLYLKSLLENGEYVPEN